MEMWMVLAAVVGFALVLLGFWFLKGKQAHTPKPELPTSSVLVPSVAAATTPTNLLDQKLGKTRDSLFGKLGKFLDRSQIGNLGAKEWEEIEEVLLEADVGVQTSLALLNAAKEKLKTGSGKSLREALHSVGVELFGSIQHGRCDISPTVKPFVISIVGINGVGKTTTIGKLAYQFTAEGKTVLLGAVDTFRAGAISQLKVWADRAGAQFVTGREGADPGAVAFDSVSAGVARKLDIVLLDTAGRLHTKSNLMDELKKIHRVVKKVMPEAPHETWLVIDGTLGQNSLVQAKEFQKTLDLTGIIVTKLDGTAKGGAVLAIAAELKLPIRYIGVGESVEDLTPFEPKPFLEAILG